MAAELSDHAWTIPEPIQHVIPQGTGDEGVVTCPPGHWFC